MPLRNTPAQNNESRGPLARAQAFINQRLAPEKSATGPPTPASPGTLSAESNDAQRLAALRLSQLQRYREQLSPEQEERQPGTLSPADLSEAADPSLASSPAAARPPTNRWLPIGPSGVLNGQGHVQSVVSGRVPAIAVTAGNERIYAGSANGGVWCSEDEGRSWRSLMDAFDVNPQANKADSLACGALAVVSGTTAAQDRIYVGSGEAHGSLDAYHGVGPIVSFDGGLNWLTEDVLGSSLVGRGFFALAVHPNDPDAVLGATQAGLYRREPLFPDERVGIWTGLDESGPFTSVLYDSQGECAYAAKQGDRVYRLRGRSLEPLENGWPSDWDKNLIGLAMQPGNDHVLYALVSNGFGHLHGLYRIDFSESGGGAWRKIEGVPETLFGSNPDKQGQGWYDLAIAVSPTDVNQVVVGGSGVIELFHDGRWEYLNDWSASLYRCHINSQTWTAASEYIGRSVHSDIHALVYAPGDEAKLWVGCDGGVFFSEDAAAGTGDIFRACNSGLATLSMNHLGQHPTNPDILFCGTQDNGGQRFTGEAAWHLSSGGDSGYFVVNWADPKRVLDTYTFSSIRRSEIGGERYQYEWINIDTGQETVNFYAPLVGTPYNPSQPHEAERVAFGGSKVWLSDTFGSDWRSIPNNNDNDWLAGVVESLLFASYHKLYVGIDNGSVYKFTFTDGVWHKQDLEAIQAGIPSLRVLDMAIDPADPAGDSIYVALGGYLWQSNAGPPVRVWYYDGSTWRPLGGKSASAGQRLLNEVHHTALVVDPQNPSHLYVGTDIGVWRSLDRGETWEPFSYGLPDSAVMDLKLHEPSRLLRVSTHGRGVFEINLDEAQRGVEIYLRNRTLFYPYLGPGASTSSPSSPDIKLDEQFRPGEYLLGGRDIIPFTEFANYMSGNWVGVNREYEVITKVYVQIHNRGLVTADEVQVMLLLAKLNGEALPPLPRGYDVAVRNGREIKSARWQTIGIKKVSGVRAANPAVATFNLSSDLLPALEPNGYSEQPDYAVVALIHHAEDPYTAPAVHTAVGDTQRKVGYQMIYTYDFSTERLADPKKTREKRPFELLFKAEHEIESGQTLAQIAELYYTARDMVEAILEVNRGVLSGEEEALPEGKRLRIPASLKVLLEGDWQREPERPRYLAQHTVVSGNTLSSIAKKYYGSGVRANWMAIYEANKAIIGPNPSLIRPGMELKIPYLDK